MRNFKYEIIILIVGFSVSTQAFAQEIHVGMPLLKVLPILSSQKCNVDTFREGRIRSYITQLQAEPFVRFGVAGQARFCFDAESGTLDGWEWTCDSIAPTDYHLIVREISKKLRDTGEEIAPSDSDIYQGPSHRWNHSAVRVFYDLNYQYLFHYVAVWEGNVCPPPPPPAPLADTTTSPPAFAPATPPPPPPVDTATSSGTQDMTNFSYDVVKAYVDPNEVMDHLTVRLSKKISKEQLASLAKRIREDKWRSDFLTIDVLLPGMNDSSDIWATASFDRDKKDVSMVGTDAAVEPHLDLTFFLSREEQRRRAVDNAIGQKIDGKVIGIWYEDTHTLYSYAYIIFEKNRKTFVRLITAGLEEGDVAWATPDEELKKTEAEGVTRLLEPDEPNGAYYIINKNGNLEFYDDYGYSATGEKIQP